MKIKNYHYEMFYLVLEMTLQMQISEHLFYMPNHKVI